MSIDALLYRELADGRNFDGLIPPHQEVVTDFEKKSEHGDTYDSLRYMDQWAGKYAWQMEHVAPLLKGGTLSETVNNIYDWLYRHFQYRLDEDLQTIYAPSAAWHYRHDGFDCKTFSVLASTILRNLGISHSFRKVQQRSVNPGEWSHVYIVIPEGRKTHIIDATRHENTEVSYTKKYDHMVKLKHRGLACACNGKPLSTSGLGSPATRGPLLERFYQFLDVLEHLGVPRSFTSALNNEFAAHINAGIDPIFSEVVNRVANRYRLTPVPAGLGMDPATMAAISSFMGGSGNAGQDMGMLQNLGQQQLQQATQQITSKIKDAIAKIIPTNFINKTFGAVLANGFNLSCWGASLTPQDAENRIKKYYKPYLAYLVGKIETAKSIEEAQTAVNNYVRMTYIFEYFYRERKPKMADWSSCAKKAITGVYNKFFASAKSATQQVIDNLTAQGAQVKEITWTQGFEYTIPGSTIGVSGDYSSGSKNTTPITIPQVDLTSVKNAIANQAVAGLNPQSGQSQTGGSQNATTPKSGSGTTGLLLAGGLILGAVLLAPKFTKDKGKGALNAPARRRKTVTRKRK